MLIEGWIVLGVFIAYLMYYILVSFLSDYHKEQLQMGKGRWYNFTWMVILILVFAILLTMSVQCWGVGFKDGGNCRYLSLTITALVIIITLINVGWDIYNSVEYDNKH